MDCLATSSPRSSEESIHSPRSKKTDISSENKPKWLQFVKEDGDIPVHSLNSSQFSGDTIKSNHPIKTSEPDHVPLTIDISDHVTSKMEDFTSNMSKKIENVHHSGLDNIHVSVSTGNKNNEPQISKEHDTQTLDNSLDSSNISSDLNDNVSEPEQSTVINFGAKPVQSEFYSRDYIINNNVTPTKPPRKKWEVKTDPYSPDAEIINKHKDLDNVEEKVKIDLIFLSVNWTFSFRSH